ncbi:MAG: ABC transporter permease [Microbacterium sp.]|jgi:peptide/nickel transport system permease protein|uniref:ABC transporter permease n=1 Tax=Microbacterium ginsengisoli TaxID=400772 RepID=A0A0F0LX16_9MICO|nr:MULTISPECIES: ABC transporter permease [Microbacterium]MAL05581.1 ABC transporter permease [Microbacterium sp.]KJL35916.1 Dipeptide transport system permease protein DppB [Microbacterium ginsengisoli]MBN9208387.1 ABC transporter permease [Microbacterium ginsengisoli]ODU77501.1 MAG: peptide ABC transporter permease [Microbacterium sp. SCN 71-21]HAN23585.1 ABC transporter permease [Microbacterium ginsengisoli]
MVTAAVDPAALAPAVSKGGGLWRYILVRLLLVIPTVFILVTVVFVLMRLTGDPITAALGGRLPPDQLQQRIHEAGYDRPLWAQYLDYLGGILRGDFGTTITDRRPVLDVLLQYGSATLELAFYALIVAFLIGIPFGLVAAYTRDRWPDATLRVGAILGYATPIFFVGLLLKLVFSVWLGVLPTNGRASTRTELLLGNLDHPSGIYLIDAIRLGNGAAVGDVLLHAILPGVALGILTAGVFLRLVRTNVIGTLGAQYVTSARSRGVSEFRLVTKHAYRPALIPIITVIGLQIAMLLSGAVLTETTFEWKGIGFMLSEYLKARDFVAVQGIVVMIAVVVALTNFVVDVIAALIDPRVRY